MHRFLRTRLILQKKNEPRLCACVCVRSEYSTIRHAKFAGNLSSEMCPTKGMKQKEPSKKTGKPFFYRWPVLTLPVRARPHHRNRIIFWLLSLMDIQPMCHFLRIRLYVAELAHVIVAVLKHVCVCASV